MKKKAIIISGLLFMVLLIALLSGVLGRFIPFTEEYDNRRYKKAYEKCREDFETLQEELLAICTKIEEEYKNVVSYSSIDFSNENRDEEWSISLKKHYGWEPVKSIALKGSKAIEHINREFGENLMFIVYQREEYFQYNIGEYCRIRIPVEAGRVLVNGK